MRCQPNNKKASLSISTNAIVVLIIAVIMLGLIIGLVTTAFGAVEARFLGEIETQPDAPGTSNAQPITINQDSVRAEAGGLIGFKVNIRNLNDTFTDAMRPILECPTAAVVEQSYQEEVLAKTIPFTTEDSFIYMTRIAPTMDAGSYLCRIQVVKDITTADPTYSAWMNTTSNRRIDENQLVRGIRPTEILVHVQ